MEGRMTVCNMSIEMGARGGLIAPDETTFDYLRKTKYYREDSGIDKEIEKWKELSSDSDAKFDKVVIIDASSIKPMVTYGTNPGMAVGVDEPIPHGDGSENPASFLKSLSYMGLKPGAKLEGQEIDYVFLGSCTNGRIEDFRDFASLVKGRKKAQNVTALLVPGSKLVEEQIRNEGLLKILNDAGFELRQPGCSSCLAMNEDKIPAGKYAVSTSNRNFEGRQGPGARTMLASPLTAAAAAVTGKITDPRTLI
jgi:3-isopropylmalate/(R)-2-methylmalate dehydratase large subunit